MVYTSGKRKELFAIKDQEHETKEIVLVNRGAFVGVGIVLGLIIAVATGLFSHHWFIGIVCGIIAGSMAAWIPVHNDKKREEYYSELIETVQDRLEKSGHPISRKQVMELLYLRDVRSDDEHIIFADTANKELVISVGYSKKKQRERHERKNSFEVLVVGEPVPAEEPADESSGPTNEEPVNAADDLPEQSEVQDEDTSEEPVPEDAEEENPESEDEVPEEETEPAEEETIPEQEQ